MKILMLNYEYPPIGGGAGRICKNISENLVHLGHQVTVITTWFEGTKEIESGEDKPTIIRIRSKRKRQFQSNPIEMYDWIIKSWKYLLEHLTTETYDVCFANFTIPGGWLALRIKRKFNIPYCVISHGHDVPWFYKKQMFFYHLITYVKIKEILREARYLFVQSKFMKKNAEKFLGKNEEKKVIQIFNGVEKREVNPEIRNHTCFTILFVGRLVKQKNPMLFLKTMKILTRMQIPYHAYVIGDGKLRCKMERWIVKNKLKHVKITGWLNDEEVWRFYEQSHIMLMPSEIEGMSISNLEALSAGLYLIASSVSGNSEMLSCCSNGELISTNNERQYANAVQSFYFKQYLNKNFIADKNRAQFTETFSWQKIALEYEKYLYSMISNHIS